LQHVAGLQTGVLLAEAGKHGVLAWRVDAVHTTPAAEQFVTAGVQQVVSWRTQWGYLTIRLSTVPLLYVTNRQWVTTQFVLVLLAIERHVL
jgi:hypothetical protein